jgi:hypothetical protein
MGIEEREEVQAKGMHNIFNNNHSRLLNRNTKSKKSMEEVFQALNENNFNPRILYPAKLSFKIDGTIKVFHDKQKLKQYMTTKTQLQKILQGILNTENESKQNHERAGNTKPQEKKRQESKSNIDSTTHNQTLNQQRQLHDRDHHVLINTNTEC